MTIRIVFSAFLVLILTSASAFATVVGGAATGGNATDQGGIFVILDPPPAAVGNNDHDSLNLFAFNEDQNINVVDDPIFVDIGSAPQVGDIVASHYIFFDPSSLITMIGYIDFDADVFGIITSKVYLDASDFLLNNSVTYNSPSLRGLEAGDTVSIDDNLANRIHINFRAGSPGDYIRVLTKRSPIAAGEVPEPSILGLFGLSLIGLLGLRRRKQ